MTIPTQFTWTDPTLNVDGSPIVPGEITGYTIGIRDVNAAGSTAGNYPIQVIAPSSATSELFSSITPPLKPGSYAASIKTDTVSASSAWNSVEVTFIIVVIPTAPSNFQIA